MPKNQFRVSGNELLDKVKALIKEGNVRRIIIKNQEGKEYLEIPVNIGILGAFFAPTLIFLGAIAAMASCFTIEVVRKEPSDKTKKTVKK